MDIEILEVNDLGSDVLEVIAGGPERQEQQEGKARTVRDRYVAYGWVSALDNHFDAQPLEQDLVEKQGRATIVRGIKGERHPDAKPRPMSAEEKRAYCLQLLREQVPAFREKKTLAI